MNVSLGVGDSAWEKVQLSLFHVSDGAVVAAELVPNIGQTEKLSFTN